MNYSLHNCSQYKQFSILTNILATFSQNAHQIQTTFPQILINRIVQDSVIIIRFLRNMYIQISRILPDLVPLPLIGWRWGCNFYKIKLIKYYNQEIHISKN